MPHIRAAEDQISGDHGGQRDHDENGKLARKTVLLGSGFGVRTCLGRRTANRNPARLMENNKPTICVFCGSSLGSDAAYAQAARRFGALIGSRGFSLLFGGGYVGLMGEVAHAARLAGAHVTGILPEFLRHLEPPSRDAQKIIITPDLQERKRLMLSYSDAFAVLPGGLGTLDEFFEAVTSAQLNALDKPVVLLDTGGFFKPLETLLAHVVAKGFAGERVASLYHRAATPEDAIAYLERKLGRAPRA
jgi:uncharacterized protein (TIGR00730 family)